MTKRVTFAEKESTEADEWMKRFDAAPPGGEILEIKELSPKLLPFVNSIATREVWGVPAEAPPVVKNIPAPIKPRKADPRSRDQFLPLRGIKAAPEPLPTKVPAVTHISSDDGLKNLQRENQLWQAQKKRGDFGAAKSISSTEVVPDNEVGAGERILQTLEIASTTVQDALSTFFVNHP